jgi:hypothetical protein
MWNLIFAARRLGAKAYLNGYALSANPYMLNTTPARVWADAWLNKWLDNEKE